MDNKKNILKILALALSLPTTIFIAAYLSMTLVEHEILSKGWAMVIFLVIISDIILLMVWYAIKKKS